MCTHVPFSLSNGDVDTHDTKSFTMSSVDVNVHDTTVGWLNVLQLLASTNANAIGSTVATAERDKREHLSFASCCDTTNVRISCATA